VKYFFDGEEYMDKELTFKNKEEEGKITAQILKALKSIRYGYIQIVVQDAKVVQIEKVEKFRINHALGFYT